MEELEIMRQQLAYLKQQLDTRQLVNDRLLRRVMRSKASWLNNLVIVEYILLPLLFLFFLKMCEIFHISNWFAGSCLILTLIDCLLDVRTVRIPRAMLGSASILELRKFLIRQKRERLIQTSVMLPLAIIWLILLTIAVLLSFVSPTANEIWPTVMIGVGIGGGVLGIISTVIVIIVFKRMQHTNDSLLHDLHELENDA